MFSFLVSLRYIYLNFFPRSNHVFISLFNRFFFLLDRLMKLGRKGYSEHDRFGGSCDNLLLNRFLETNLASRYSCRCLVLAIRENLILE